MSSKVIVSIAFVFAVVGSVNDGVAALPRGQRAKIVEQVVPAYQQGDSVALLLAASPLAKRLGASREAEIDKLLGEHDVPPLGELLAEARLALIHQRAAGAVPEPTASEIQLVVPALHVRITRTLDLAKNHAVMANPLPIARDFDEYKQMLWDAHVLKNQLQATRYVARVTAAWAGRIPRRVVYRLDEDQASTIDADYDALIGQIDDVLHELAQRDIESRLRRLEHAVEVLAESEDTKERFIASYVLDLDARVVTGFLREIATNADRQWTRPRLSEPDLSEEVEQTVARGRELAGGLEEKSRLLFTGLHWWMRGRYGSGPDGWGLLKGVAALESEAAMFPLYMPVETPKPTDPMVANGYPAPEYDRRHHYTWGWEDRRIYTTRNVVRKTEAKTSGINVVSIPRFY